MPKKAIEMETKPDAVPSNGTEQQQPEQAAYIQMQQLGYTRYTFAKEFEEMSLNTDPRAYPVAKRVDILLIKEKDGSSPYVGLGFIGILDEKLFLIVMRKEDVKKSIAEIGEKNVGNYIGLEFFGVNKRFGGVGTIALPLEVYNKFAKAFQS
ncbi:MAG: hypothetical protein QXN16_00700 [Candidatus Micrarchaeaceae archaeon]